MNRLVALALGAAAWAGVAAVALLVVFNIGHKNQVLMFLPILGAVVVAWGIGEIVTQRAFGGGEEVRRWR